jgi:HSP20 family protein
MKVKNNAFVPGIFNLMDRFMTDDFQTPTHLSRPAVNIIESDKAYTLEIMAAGLKKDDFKIAIEKDLLTISYEKKEATEETTDKYIRREFTSNSFKRSFTLNDRLNAEEISARYENGILIVEIPKAEVKEIKVKELVIN